MSTLRKLQAALAAVPLNQPCTATAVEALYAGGHAAARQLSPVDIQPRPSASLQGTCIQQQVPGACMPVLTWLAAGLRNGLPPAATQKAHEMACALLGVVTSVLPDQMMHALGTQPVHSPHVMQAAAGMLAQLGSVEEMCRQLATVVAALVDTTFPGGAANPTTSSANGHRPSNAAPLQQRTTLAPLWHQIGQMLLSTHSLYKRNALGTALINSGLYQVLLEGNLLLLGADPAAYPQAKAKQDELFYSMKSAGSAAIFLSSFGVDQIVHNAWSALPGSSWQPWMRPLLKLKLLLLSKLLWDARQNPDLLAAKQFQVRWPAKALHRAGKQMVSPCVAGDLLRQRAPGLVPPVHSIQQLLPSSRDGLSLHAAGYLRGMSPSHLAHCLGDMSCYLAVAAGSGQQVLDALDLGLLLEVSELYCHVNLSGPFTPVEDRAWPIMVAVSACPPQALTTFTATCGEALISIAEHLVQDVLLAMASSGSATSAPRFTAAATAKSSSKMPSSSTEKLRYASSNPSVALEHRQAWAQDVLFAVTTVLCQQLGAGVPQGQAAGGSQAGPGLLLTASNALRISRLLETFLRTPRLMGSDEAYLWDLLPKTLPALYTTASSSDGSAALLSTITSAAKRQQVLNTALAALVAAGGQVKPAAAGLMAKVPGPMGRVMAEQVLRETAGLVKLACSTGKHLAGLAEGLLARVAALLDPEVAPAAACLSRKQPPGQEGKPGAVEVLLGDPERSGLGMQSYKTLLSTDPQQLAAVTKGLEAAVIQQHAASARKQAARLAQASSIGQGMDAKQLCQQLQGIWLGRDVEVAGGGQAGHAPAITPAAAASSAAAPGPEELPFLVQALCDAGVMQREEVLAAGDSGAWAAAMVPATPEDLRVAATALLAACKAAGAVAQLPQLLEQVQGIMRALKIDLPRLQSLCSGAAEWVLLLAPVLGLLLPAGQAAQLQEVAAGARSDGGDSPLLLPDTVSCVLGMLGHVVAPGAPGCSYPGCCNLQGSSEAELPVQACSKCKGVRYCCREHQVAHWKAGHKEVCQAAQAAVKQVCDVAAGGCDDQVHSEIMG